MGMFDWVNVEYPLPNGDESEKNWQTKDLDCLMDVYTIAEDGDWLEYAALFCDGILQSVVVQR